MMIAWVYTAIDIFRRPDESGITKFLWLLLILFLPVFGMLTDEGRRAKWHVTATCDDGKPVERVESSCFGGMGWIEAFAFGGKRLRCT